MGIPPKRLWPNSPPEIVEDIVGLVQLLFVETFFEKRFREWLQVTSCLDGWCHASVFENDHYENYQKDLNHHLEEINSQTQQSMEGRRFAKVRKVRT